MHSIKIGSLVKIPKNLSHVTHALWFNSQKILHKENYLIGTWYPSDIALVVEIDKFSIKIFTFRTSGWIKKEYCEIIQ